MSGIGQPEFNLVNHFGEPVTHASYPGQSLLVYFGFTHCKVVCPRSLNRLSDVLNALPEDLLAKLKPLYITVDPERDTPDVMKAYVESHFPKFMGLSGDEMQIDAAKKSFKVFARKKLNPGDPEGYDVPHSAITYLIGLDGHYETHWVDTKSADDIEADLLSYFKH